MFASFYWAMAVAALVGGLPYLALGFVLAWITGRLAARASRWLVGWP